MLQLLVSHTPIWVWVLLAFLVTRGINAMKPGETSLSKLAIVPALFTVWGVWSINARYPASWEASALWGGALPPARASAGSCCAG